MVYNHGMPETSVMKPTLEQLGGGNSFDCSVMIESLISRRYWLLQAVVYYTKIINKNSEVPGIFTYLGINETSDFVFITFYNEPTVRSDQ